MNIDLEPARLDQVEAYYSIFSSSSVCRYMDIAPFKSLEESERFLKFSEEQKNNRKSFRHSVIVDGRCVGTTCLYSIYWHQKRASIGYALRESHWNKGIMTVILDKIDEIARTEFEINRLQATVLTENSGSRRLLLKSGFMYEGLLRQYEIWDGKGFVDLEMYSKLVP